MAGLTPAIGCTISGAMRGALLFVLLLAAGPAGIYDTPPAPLVCDPPPAAPRHCRPLLPGEDVLHPGHFLPPPGPPQRPQGYTTT